MTLADHVHTFGQYMLHRHGRRVHKIALDAGLTCPNRDGSKGRGGCTFCNNVSFSPYARQHKPIAEQLSSGRAAIALRTRAQRYIAYFQAYTNTYADVDYLDSLYRSALSAPDIIGISVGTRPDCVPDAVLDLLASYQQQGYDVWLELGLQSAFDETLTRINRGHDLASYRLAVRAARQRGIRVCTHLIIGLPGEGDEHYHASLDTVLEFGVDGLKLHPLHVVRGTHLANQWRKQEYTPLSQPHYCRIAADLIERTPEHIVFHRVTGTAASNILLAPDWCAGKWNVLNGITAEFERRHRHQGDRANYRPVIQQETAHAA